MIIVITLIVLGLSNFYNLATKQNEFNTIVKHDAIVLENAWQLEKLVVDMETGKQGYIITGKDDFIAPYHNAIEAFYILAEKEITLISDNQNQLKALYEIIKLVDEWKIKAAIPEITLARKYHDELSLNNGSEVSTISMADLAILLQKATEKNISNKIKLKFSSFINEEKRLTSISLKEARQSSSSIKIISIIILLFGSIGGLIMSVILAKSISKPILELKNTAIEITKGNLNKSASILRNDEIGLLSKHMEIMRLNLQKTLRELTDYQYAIDETSIVVITNSKGIIIYANKQFFEISKYSYEEVLGKNHSIVSSGHHSSEFFKEMWSKIQAGKIFNAEFKNKNKHGEIYWVNNTIVPFKDENDKIYQYVSIKKDVSDSKKLNNTLGSLVDKLKLAKENQSQFLSNMSHEIRTPMNGVIGMTRLLQKTSLNNEQKKYTDAIFTSSNNLIVIINEILDFSKIEAGKLTIEHTPFSIHQKLIIWNETLGVSAKDKNINLEINLNENVPEHLIGDPVRLSQIIYNLGGNAIKFTQNGNVTINIFIENIKDNIVNLQVDVIDDGIGINKDKFDSIFSSFAQANPNTTRKYGGTGLGLTITKQLIELQDGKIWITSEVGKGSTFSFTIPYSIDNKRRNITLATQHNISCDNLKGLNILLVEDHEINQLLAITILENWNSIVDVAENGLIAVEKVKENNYDVILMDINMPEMDGYGATKEIRNTLNDNTPIIALTASALISDNHKCYDAGMNDFISKPFNPELLLTKIKEQIKKGYN